MQDTSPPSVRHFLRERTRPAHERTDDAFTTLDLSERGDYGSFLASHYLAYSVLEPVFAADLPVEARPPVMTGFLAEDLAILGVDMPDAMAGGFDGDALGAAYVIAGSNFGKRVLLKRWSRSTDPAVLAAGRYLGSPALTEYWPVLNGVIDGAEDCERLAAGADATFQLFERCLAQVRA